MTTASSRTVEEVERELRTGDLVHRYRGADGLEGDEGAFFITSFWLVEALLTVGRADEARELFEHLLKRANDVGLYAEEADVRTGAFLGNFPQAFTHLSLFSSAALLQLHERKGAKALHGSNTARAKRIAGATEGLRALIYALIRNRSHPPAILAEVRPLPHLTAGVAGGCGNRGPAWRIWSDKRRATEWPRRERRSTVSRCAGRSAAPASPWS